MNRIVLGKYVNTHGIKGEIRIKSSFKYKDKVFSNNNEIIIDKPYIITGHRIHKKYDMVTLKDIDSIDDIPFSKNSMVYIDRDKYLLDDDYLDDDLLKMEVVYKNSIVGIISDIRYISDSKKLFVVNNNLIPFELIKTVDLMKKQVILENVEGLVNEN